MDKRLFSATLQGNKENVRSLLEMKCPANAVKKGWTPLMHASKLGHLEVARSLIDHKADLEIANKVCSQRENLNSPNSSNSQKQGWTALMFAVRYGRTRIMNLLLNCGANISRVNKDGFSALCVGAYYGQVEAVRQLIKAKADLNYRQKGRQWTALMCAARFGFKDVVKQLVDAGADTEITDIDQFSPLSVATYFGKLNVVRILMRARADLERKNKDGDTPLFIATRKGFFDILGILIDNGAKVNIRNNHGQNLRWICKDWKRLRSILKKPKPAGATHQGSLVRSRKRSRASAIGNSEGRGRPAKKSHKKKFKHEELQDTKTEGSSATWICAQCTLENKSESVFCEICGFKKRRKAVTKTVSSKHIGILDKTSKSRAEITGGKIHPNPAPAPAYPRGSPRVSKREQGRDSVPILQQATILASKESMLP
eukprot:1314368-Amorphochlora_amoeboformis.AAC.1